MCLLVLSSTLLRFLATIPICEEHYMHGLRGAVAAAAIVLGSAACYHATIETGATPSTTTISKPWAPGFVYGLVPPNTVETAAKCPNGVAKVETQLTFLNQLVTVLTLGIYTPMSIEVTCGTGKGVADATGH
jgi:Bor protein